MNEDRRMAIIANDLDSLFHRIESLRAHPKLTGAGEAVDRARELIKEARVEIHQDNLRKRYDV